MGRSVGQSGLSFLVIVPEWSTQGAFRPTSPVDDLAKSIFLRATMVRKPHQHTYVKGRCWMWSKLKDSGPAVAQGVSNSRVLLLSNCLQRAQAEAILASLGDAWEST